MREETPPATDRRPTAPPPIPDEPGNDVQPTPVQRSPVAEEPGDSQTPDRFEGLPIPEEL